MQILIMVATLGLIYLLYHIIVYFFTRVPHIITPQKRLETIFKELIITPETVIYDLGCGKGDLLFGAEKFGFKKLVGVELSPFLAWWGMVKAKLLKSKVKISRENFFDTDISKADIIYLFLVQAVVNKLALKLKNEAKIGATIICLADQVPGLTLEKIINTNPEDKNSVKIYFYKNELV